jgi:hypothetical protein
MDRREIAQKAFVLSLVFTAALSANVAHGSPHYSAPITTHPTRAYCSDVEPVFNSTCVSDRWFFGENREDVVPDSEALKYISGSDSTLSVQVPLIIDLNRPAPYYHPLSGSTFFYTGDTAPSTTNPPSLIDCDAPAAGGKPDWYFCNDSILVSHNKDFVPLSPLPSFNDTTPQNGVDTRIVLDHPTEGSTQLGFKPLLIPGVNLEGWSTLPLCVADRPLAFPPVIQWGPGCMGDFAAPSGAVTVVRMGEDGHPYPEIILWFTSGALFENKTSSWMACSTDGIDFSPCHDGQIKDDGYSIYPFSTKMRATVLGATRPGKFVMVQPVLVEGADITDACTPLAFISSPLCALPQQNGAYRDTILLFGTSTPYRDSPVYLAEMDPDSFQVRYYKGLVGGKATWSSSETDAVAVLPGYFGEISVKLVQGSSEPSDFYFVMLSKNRCDYFDQATPDPIDGSVDQTTIDDPTKTDPRLYFQYARFTFPNQWSGQFKTSGDGYSPYIVDAYTTVASGKLNIYHSASGWRGELHNGAPLDPFRYGAFTRKLRLANASNTPVDVLWPPTANTGSTVCSYYFN